MEVLGGEQLRDIVVTTHKKVGGRLQDITGCVQWLVSFQHR